MIYNFKNTMSGCGKKWRWCRQSLFFHRDVRNTGITSVRTKYLQFSGFYERKRRKILKEIKWLFCKGKKLLSLNPSVVVQVEFVQSQSEHPGKKSRSTERLASTFNGKKSRSVWDRESRTMNSNNIKKNLNSLLVKGWRESDCYQVYKMT